MIRDLRYAVRTLIQSPGFTIVAVLTLALGIAANTAIFSAAKAILLHPLPFPDAEQLVDITKTMLMFELFQAPASALDFLDYRAQNRSFSQIAAIEDAQFSLTGGREAELVPGMRVSTSLFPQLDVTPILGRAFTPKEEQWGKQLLLATVAFAAIYIPARRAAVVDPLGALRYE